MTVHVEPFQVSATRLVPVAPMAIAPTARQNFELVQATLLISSVAGLEIIDHLLPFHCSIRDRVGASLLAL
jgi:hypothetical protein